jgi:hypothetical protein
MALAESVTGAGKVISGGTETGSYSQVLQRGTATDPKPDRLLTVFYTDVRSERKWYALTKAAIDAYIAANPTVNVNYSITNEVTGAYEMTVTTVTRTVTGYSITTIEETET